MMLAEYPTWENWDPESSSSKEVTSWLSCLLVPATSLQIPFPSPKAIQSLKVLINIYLFNEGNSLIQKLPIVADLSESSKIWPQINHLFNEQIIRVDSSSVPCQTLS